MEYNKVNMFLGPEQFDWIYKDNPVTIPSSHKGTTDVNFASDQSKKSFMVKINLKK